VWLDRAVSIDRLGISVTVAGTTGNGRLLVYADSAGLPGALARDCGTVSLAAVHTPEVTFTPALNLDPGRYYFTIQAAGLTGSATVRATTEADYVPLARSEAAGAAAIQGFFRNGATTGTPFNPLGKGNGAIAGGPMFWARLAANPS
jgi:hypothetical protein